MDSSNLSPAVLADIAPAGAHAPKASSISSGYSLDKKSADIYLHRVSTSDLVEPDPVEETRVTEFLLRRKAKVDPDAIATKRSVFDDPVLAKHYWPKDTYENRHRFDPDARWTYREEQAIVRKIDWRVMFWAAISFSALNLDRNNLGAANSDNLLGDLGLSTDDFNWGNSIFRLAFLCAELPSQMVSKRLGPDRWIPTQMCAWSVVTICQFWLSGRTSFFVTRALLGFIQGGFIPDLILYLSYFYTKYELPYRLSLFWMSSNLCSIIASFIAFGVLHMRGVQGKAGWRWLFLVEGIITLVIGITTFFQMPPSPTQTKAWFRPNGWFTEREETIVVSRVLRDDPTKVGAKLCMFEDFVVIALFSQGDMHNREGLTLKRLWTAIWDYDLWPIYILGLMFGIPTGPPATYLTLSLRNLGFDTFHTNLLTIPSSVLGIISMFGITFISERVNDRSFVAMAQDLWGLPFIVAIYCLPVHPNQWLFFGLTTALLAYPYTHPIQVAWCSRNAGAVASRTVNASLYNMFVQASSVIYSQIYRTDDAPRYRRGNRVLIAISVVNITILYPGTKLYYIWRNKQRAKIWDAMTREQQSEYLTTTKDVGNRRLDFKFAH
ncbi:allantoate permease [Auriscalpium vulgare]|uniref:Allantoate permease n=1 Tax=Auriscalpium vulgare TaxID=40419 RepID=A0ACB8S9L1_9AGAM|nr:allantoate permease [Auriscalpium vulgare]